MRQRSILLGGVFSVAMATATGACDGEPRAADGPRSSTESTAAQRLAALRSSFRVRSLATGEPRLNAATSWASIGPSAAESFERSGDRFHVHLRSSVGAAQRVKLTMPVKANGAAELVDETSGVSVEMKLAGAEAVEGELVDGVLMYRHALDEDGDLIQRPVASGTEDYLAFPRAPSHEEVRYEVVLGPKVAGLRLVADTLEFLDHGGTPRLRIAPPSAIGSDGEVRFVRVALAGCNADTNPAAPWDRLPVPPGSRRCTVRFDWSGLGFTYPMLLDPAWVSTGSLAQGRVQHTSEVLADGKVLVIGGARGSAIATTEIYNPTSSTWATTGSLASGRFDHASTRLANGKVLVAGGQSSSARLSSAELYDPATGTWSAAGSMATARSLLTATTLANGRVLAASGQGASYLTSAEIYDPATNSWSNAGNLASGRRWHTASLIGNDVLIVGGAAGTVFNTAERYNPGTNSWTSAGTMTSARYYHTATVLSNGKVLVAGGDPAGAKSEIYDPATNQWTPTGNMTASHLIHTATLLTNGNVLVAGGIGAFSVAELYDPAAGTWSATATMTSGRFYHTASLLSDGSVLLASGAPNQSSQGDTSAERYVALSAGTACTTPATCQSGFCVDGVCCNVACDGECQSCNTQSAIGTCSPTSGETCDGGVCNAGACVPPSADDAGIDSGERDSGGPSGGDAGSSSDAGSPTDGDADDGGCSCRSASLADRSGSWWWPALAFGAAVIARRTWSARSKRKPA